MTVSKDGGPQENPRFATNPDADDIDEPTAHRSPGFQFEEEIPNAFFNWLSQTWGNFLDHIASNTRTFALLKDARDHARLEPGDQFRYSPQVNPDGTKRAEFDTANANELGRVDPGSNSGAINKVATGGNYVVAAVEGTPEVRIYEPDLSGVVTTITNFVGTVADMHVATDGEYYWIAYQDTANSQTVVHTFNDFTGATDAKADETGRKTYATQYDIKDVTSRAGQIVLALYDSSVPESLIEYGRNSSFTNEATVSGEAHSVAAHNIRRYDDFADIAWTLNNDDVDGAINENAIGNFGSNDCKIAVDNDHWYVIGDPSTDGSDAAFFKFGHFHVTNSNNFLSELTAMKQGGPVVCDGRNVYAVSSNGGVQYCNIHDGLVRGSGATDIDTVQDLAVDGRALYACGSNGGSGPTMIAFHMLSAPVEWQYYPASKPHPYMALTLGPAR